MTELEADAFRFGLVRALCINDAKGSRGFQMVVKALAHLPDWRKDPWVVCRGLCLQCLIHLQQSFPSQIFGEAICVHLDN